MIKGREMNPKNIVQNRKRKKTFSRIRNGTLEPKTLPPYERGLYYEEEVCRFLKTRGYCILDRNYRARKQSEIDIVAKCGTTLVFVEVKARRRLTVFSPLRAVDETKRRALAFAVRDYLYDLSDTGVDIRDLTLRYDVAALYFDGDGHPCCLDYYEGYLEEAHEGL